MVAVSTRLRSEGASISRFGKLFDVGSRPLPSSLSLSLSLSFRGNERDCESEQLR